MSVRWKVEPGYNDGGIVNFYEMYGLSTDEKPIFDKMATGSTFTEVDTGDSYFYDEESGEFIPIGGDSTAQAGDNGA